MGEGESCCTSRPRVHFPQEKGALATVLCEIEDVLSLTSEDKTRLWFSRSDYDFSKSSARVVAKESERYGKSKHLDNTYVKTFDQDAQTSLNLWAMHGPQRRGLERWANSAHGDLRKKDQHRYTSSLLRAQTDMKLKGVEPSVRTQMLQTIGEGLSQRSRQFAQMMASADAEAAKWEQHGTAAAAAAEENVLVSTPKQAKRASLGLGGSRPNLRGVARTRSAASPNLGGIARTRSSTGSPGTATRRGSGGPSPRITIRTRPAPRVSRIA
mmetsp:Transcript_8719/g.20871  ORF Transcript_8719/g.20871 Transcript_8719/m.20871 type:complete len:269 (+) Transcript_8719:142-948(+)|eukprot:CAMPEP_0113625210 /NCGR_PEP_ID=MMETSP0017_2-20120614/13021_1 /TAXON_ID=2856 /ORGANISM="Cylindrotheca closterium" /LENGTH=268 /DNA_ID=CAMNT_0000535315 /DNA_START=142 /DNA_END=948 /DNA_ORIENTATION=- /assembly_acc=CAM_ASM_000147